MERKQMAKVNKQTTMEEVLGVEVPEVEAKEIPASEKQIKFYSDLCVQKNVTFNAELTEKNAVDAEIKKLMAMPFWKPCHENQQKAIAALCEVLNLKEPDYSKLNGNYGASASQLITKLQKKAEGVVNPITEKQLAIVKEMQFCADISDLIDEPEKMDKKEASEYIKKHSTVYFAWKNTRPTEKQIETVKMLTKENGDELSLEAIYTFNRENISEYISQLFAERKDKELNATTLEPEIDIREKKDAMDELYELMNNLYASIGQAMEEEEFQNVTWSSLKELVDFVKLFGINVEGFFDRTEHFDANQIAYLIA
jgi:hypothetical protein